METGTRDPFCTLPTNNDTPYSTPLENCTPINCRRDQTLSPNCRCAFPYTGSLVLRAPSFSDLGNPTIYEALNDQMIDYFRATQLPVDSVSLRNPSKNLDGYLVIILQLFPFADERFNRTGLLDVGFSLSNQTFKPNDTFGTYYFQAVNYDFNAGNIFFFT